MKKILSAVLALGICISMTACGESMQKPTEPTQPEPLWAMSPEEREEVTQAAVPPTEAATQAPSVLETEPPTEAATEPVITEATEPAATEATEAAEPTLKMEEKFQPAEGILYAKKAVNVRDQANIESNVITKLDKADPVKRIGISQDGWTAVLYEDKVRYISTDYLVEEQPEKDPDPNQIDEQPMDDQVYTNHAVNMREGPAMDKAVLVKVPEYTELHRIGYVTSGWNKVEYKDQVGYIIDGYLTPKYADTDEHPEETVVDETIYTTREVNLRKGPSTEKQILGRIPEGTEVHRIATTSNEWSKVIYNDQEGYISSKYVSKDAPTQEEPVG